MAPFKASPCLSASFNPTTTGRKLKNGKPLLLPLPPLPPPKWRPRSASITPSTTSTVPPAIWPENREKPKSDSNATRIWVAQVSENDGGGCCCCCCCCCCFCYSGCYIVFAAPVSVPAICFCCCCCCSLLSLLLFKLLFLFLMLVLMILCWCLWSWWCCLRRSC